jgi:aminocarboxymuconate-semialdehyde decarboxylase
MHVDRIDVHCHYTGGVAQQLFGNAGYTLTGGATVGRWTLDGALAFMDRHGIAVQILSLPFVMPLPWHDPGFAVRFAREVNEDLAHIIKEHPDRFGAFATVPLNNPDEALTEIR